MVTIILAYIYTLVSFVALFVAVKITYRWAISNKKKLGVWLLFGFVFHLFSFSWLYTTYPLEWMPPGALQLVGISVIHIVLSFCASLGFLVVGAFFILEKHIPQLIRPLGFGVSLYGAEIVRSLGITLLFLGKGGDVSLHYTASALGNALGSTPLVELAYFGGAFGLTFVLGLLVFSISEYQRSRSYGWYLIFIVFACIVIHYIIPTANSPSSSTVGIVTTNFPTYSDEEITSSFIRQHVTIHAQTQSLEKANPDIIIYPEDTRYIEYSDIRVKSYLASTFSQSLLIDGNTNLYQSKMVNVSYFYTPKSGEVKARGKSFLLPFNEYIPYAFKPVFTLFIPKDQMDDYIQNHTYTPIYSKKTIPFNNQKIGTLICSEILSHKTIHDLKKEQPSVVFYQSRLNVFHDSPIAWAMLYSATRIAAAQLRTPLISSSNAAPSFIISPHGSTIRIIPTGFSTSTIKFP